MLVIGIKYKKHKNKFLRISIKYPPLPLPSRAHRRPANFLIRLSLFFVCRFAFPTSPLFYSLRVTPPAHLIYFIRFALPHQPTYDILLFASRYPTSLKNPCPPGRIKRPPNIYCMYIFVQAAFCAYYFGQTIS